GAREQDRRAHRRERLRRRRDPVRGGDAVRPAHRLRTEHPAGRRRVDPRTRDDIELEPRGDLRRRLHGGGNGMSDVYTRRQLLERAAAGGAVLTLPGFLAACGGSSSKSASSAHKLAKTLRFSNWTLYIDIDQKTKSHPSLDQFQKQYGVHVQYTEDINDNA